MPALFTSTSSTPKRSQASDTAWSTAARSRTSACAVSTAAPCSRHSSAVKASWLTVPIGYGTPGRSRPMSMRATSAPSFAKAIAQARPSPLAAPVTTMALSRRRKGHPSNGRRSVTGRMPSLVGRVANYAQDRVGSLGDIHVTAWHLLECEFPAGSRGPFGGSVRRDKLVVGAAKRRDGCRQGCALARHVLLMHLHIRAENRKNHGKKLRVAHRFGVILREFADSVQKVAVWEAGGPVRALGPWSW